MTSMNTAMKNIKFLSLSMCLVCMNIVLAHPLHAQDRNEEVTIIAPYKPTISDANKMNFQPSISDQGNMMPAVEFSLRSKLYETKVNPKPIEATKKPTDPKKKLLRNLIRAGFGNYVTPYFEFFANSRQSSKHAFGVHLRHISSYGDIKDYAPSDYSQSDVQVYGKKFIGDHTFSANIFYDHDIVHYYGFMPDEYPEMDFPKDDIRHRFQTFGLDAGIGSNFTSGTPFNYHTEIRYYYIEDNYKASEHNIFFGGLLDKEFQFSSITENQSLGLDLDFNYFINADSISDYNGALLKLEPFISTDFNQYKFYLGVNLTSRIETSTRLHVYPAIRVEIKLLKDALALFAGINGSLDRVTLRSLSLENPFINSTLPLEYTNHKFVFDAGILGNISQNLNYQVSGSTSIIDNMPFYVNDTMNGLGNMFTLVYDNVNVLNLHAGLGFQRSKVLNLWLGADYYQYKMDKEEKPWQKPNYRIKFGGDYIIQDKYIVKAELFVQGPMYAKLYESGEVLSQKMNGWADLNLGFEYRITNSFSAFVNINNALNNGYFKWYNYPVQKINVLAGVSFAF